MGAKVRFIFHRNWVFLWDFYMYFRLRLCLKNFQRKTAFFRLRVAYLYVFQGEKCNLKLSLSLSFQKAENRGINGTDSYGKNAWSWKWDWNFHRNAGFSWIFSLWLVRFVWFFHCWIAESVVCLNFKLVWLAEARIFRKCVSIAVEMLFENVLFFR